MRTGHRKKLAYTDPLRWSPEMEMWFCVHCCSLDVRTHVFQHGINCQFAKSKGLTRPEENHMMYKGRGMTPKQYQELAARTLNLGADHDTQIMTGALGLCGESGEVADIIKKHYEQGWPFDEAARAKLEKELGDTAWYLAKLCTLLNFDLEVVLQKNISKLEARYPKGFSVQASVERKDH